MSDDQTARCVANGIGVSISGTIGILVRCMGKDIISFLEGIIILAGMIQKGYMSPVDSLEVIAPPTDGLQSRFSDDGVFRTSKRL
ncbi:MAG: hypothetical protein C5S49_00725 [Candidatus Methanogaster sp.]|nr:MAG: hypothetical protein C5S49_00725 [ANME-2 cluster archaeon]